MADHGSSPALSTPGSSNGANSPANGQPSTTGGSKRNARPSQRVKFTMGDEEDGANSHITPSMLEAGLGHENPMDLPTDSIDIGEVSLSTPSWVERKRVAAEKARSAADRIAFGVSRSAPSSRRNSGSRLSERFSEKEPASPPLKPLHDWAGKLEDLPLQTLDQPTRPYDINDDTDDDDVDELKPLERNTQNIEEARRLIRTLTNNVEAPQFHNPRSGTQTPYADRQLHDLDWVPQPERFKPGILGAILSSRLGDLQRNGFQQRHVSHGAPVSRSASKRLPSHSREQTESFDSSAPGSNQSSGRTTPSRRPKWYKDSGEVQSSSSVATLLGQAGLSGAAPGMPATSGPTSKSHSPHGGTTPSRPYLPRSRSNNMITSAVDIIKSGTTSLRSKSDLQQDIHMDTVLEIADIIGRRKYLIKLCSALMMYGAPTHRLEEYMRTSARVLQIEAEFLYMPGSMLCCFIDSVTYSTNVEMVRTAQGVDLGRFKDIFEVYKCVIHHKYTADEALEQLEIIIKKKNRYPTWLRVVAFGVAAVAVSPWAFSARPIDFGPIFLLGTTLGCMQLQLVPRSEQFAHVFEVAASVLTAFVARGLGSISRNGVQVFCFSAMAQSSIALILPGYIVLNAALELQSRNMVSGSVRMVYAIIYTLFLGFGLLVGTTIYGIIDRNATSEVTCHMPTWWDTAGNNWRIIYVKFFFVPIFAACLALINQAKVRQMPVMVLIAFCGYQANFWISTRIANNIQVANAIGAFVIGAMANLYSRLFHGLAAAAMLPAIFVQVPSGLAASGSLVAGITSANQITGNSTGISIINNGTQGFLNAQNQSGAGSNDSVYGGTIFNVGYGMVQVAIGISVGLYLSAIVVYPFGKRKSGLFSF